MKLLKIIEESLNERYIDIAVEALLDGNIIIYPTDTLYALGCDALNNGAIEKICRIKGVKSEKTNLSIICESISQVAEYAHFDNDEFRMMKANLPGPFTFIFPAMSKLPKAFKGRKTVGVRVPDDKIAIELVHRLGRPIMTSSIEYEDEDYGTEPELIAERYVGDVSLILDSGRRSIVPSTIIDCTGDEPEIVREGKGVLK
ncbi:MAG: threonylcarbamoyl-AMP synthase [Muribaculaceae bacterium]|jgi:tRNA threonylcarbamoyl adenosine modification protein (Sua5/YciO/YrdC/YwlC family)|nr:threonylcarbamoyl-AMP synthase [Muribaculaceae bacterium]